jgi:2,4-dienoyl-CoA reductase-like NADH-dependent reductase (Old Yellow Enzyme family)
MHSQRQRCARNERGLTECKFTRRTVTSVTVKMNSEDFLDDGLTINEMLDVASMLQAAGIDAIELSGGVIDPACHFIPIREGTPLTEEEESYYRHAAKRFKERISAPLILVGGIRSFEIARELIADMGVDFVAISRPLIREPHLIARWQANDMRKSECGSCNGCFGPIQRGEGFYCFQRNGSPEPTRN